MVSHFIINISVLLLLFLVAVKNNGEVFNLRIPVGRIAEKAVCVFLTT